MCTANTHTNMHTPPAKRDLIMSDESLLTATSLPPPPILGCLCFELSLSHYPKLPLEAFEYSVLQFDDGFGSLAISNRGTLSFAKNYARQTIPFDVSKKSLRMQHLLRTKRAQAKRENVLLLSLSPASLLSLCRLLHMCLDT